MRMLLCLALAGGAAGQEPAPGLHRFDPTAEDRARLERGLLPQLILEDGALCAGGLFRVVPWLDDAFTQRTGQRERTLAPGEAAVLRADERGIVWYEPPSDHFWQRRASHGDRPWSFPQLRQDLMEVRAAARFGILWSVAELRRTVDLSVEVLPSRAFAPDEPPVFIFDADGVLQRAERKSASSCRTLERGWGYTRNDEDHPPQIVAGFDFARGIPLERAHDAARFDLSDCGTLEVMLFDERGAPLQEPLAVFLEPADSDAAQEWSLWRWAPANSPSVLSADGVARLAGVPPGRRWRVGAFLLPGSAIVSMACEGPAQPGETRRVGLSAREQSVLLRARLQAEDGGPASGAAGELRGEGGAHVPFRADDDGLLIVRAPRAWLAANEELQILDEYDSSRIGMAAKIAAAPLLEDGLEHRWIWSEQTADLLAQGRVVDDSGEGVPFAEVFAFTGGGKTDARGYFRIEGEGGADELIWVASDWFIGSETPFTKGARGLEVRTVLGARIAGVLAAPQGSQRPVVTFLRSQAGEPVFVTDEWWSGEGECEVGPVPVEAIEIRFDFEDGESVVLRGLPLVAGEVHRLAEPLRPNR